MTTLERHECLSSLYEEWHCMPDGEPVRRDRWFGEVAQLIAGMPKAESRERWIRVFAAAIHEKQDGLPIAVCTYIVQQRVEAVQKGGIMNFTNCTPNHRLLPIAASGTAEELLGKDQEFIPAEYADYDRRVLMVALLFGAVVFGAVVLGVAFWPAILGWMTEFRYGVVVGMVSAAVLIVGARAIGVCLGAGRLEKSR